MSMTAPIRLRKLEIPAWEYDVAEVTPPSWREAVDAIVSHRLAARPVREIPGGPDLVAVLAEAGWLDLWDRPDETWATLSAWGAIRRGVRLDLLVEAREPRWVALGSRPAPLVVKRQCGASIDDLGFVLACGHARPLTLAMARDTPTPPPPRILRDEWGNEIHLFAGEHGGQGVPIYLSPAERVENVNRRRPRSKWPTWHHERAANEAKREVLGEILKQEATRTVEAKDGQRWANREDYRELRSLRTGIFAGLGGGLGTIEAKPKRGRGRPPKAKAKPKGVGWGSYDAGFLREFVGWNGGRAGRYDRGR